MCLHAALHAANSVMLFCIRAIRLRHGAIRCWDSHRTIATVISGKKTSQQMMEHLKKDVEEMSGQFSGFRPGLVVLQVGDRDDSNLYISMKLKAAAKIGINANHIRLPKTATEDEVLQSISMFNENPEVHGLIVQLPLDSVNFIDTEKVTNAVAPEKDVDGLSSVSAGKLARGDLKNCFMPCTPNGVMKLIRQTGVSLSGTNAVVIGRSKIVGAPMHDLLLWNHVTVTSCHSRTPDLAAHVGRADVLVVGTGRAEMVKGEWIKEGAVVIDVGINYIPDKRRPGGMRVVGDVHYPSAVERAGFITPVPGGVGPMTVAMLMENTIKSAKQFLQIYRPGSWNISYTQLKQQRPQPSHAQISRCRPRKPIGQLAKEIGLYSKEMEPYGRGRAKVSLDVLKRLSKQPDGKYIVVTGITQTPLGETQSTITLGLAHALGAHMKVNTLACVEQPSPRYSLHIRKGVAGAYSQIPMEEAIFQPSGDTEALSAACGVITDTITTYCYYQSRLSDQAMFELLVPFREGHQVFLPHQLKRLQRLGIDKSDPSTLTQKELERFVQLDVDLNTNTDRLSLENEIMAVVSLSSSADDLQARLDKMVVVNSKSGEPVTTEDLGVSGVLSLLLNNTVKPCLMQTLEGTPVFLHAGPLTDDAQGSPSVMADKTALKLVGPEGFVVTETAHAGMDKFFNVTCHSSGLQPDVLVFVTTVQALKVYGRGAQVTSGFPLPEMYTDENLKLLRKGCDHLKRQVENARVYGLPVIVAVNTSSRDTEAELELVCSQARQAGVFEVVQCTSWTSGGTGALDLAHSVRRAAEIPSTLRFLYDLQLPVIDKIKAVAQKTCGAKDVELTPKAKEKLALYIKQGFENCPVCINETCLPLSKDSEAPEDFTLIITDIQAYVGAGFLYLVPDTKSGSSEDPMWPCWHHSSDLHNNGQ
ncbi:C-1-tetrahydrofolate synthase, cytoplasmic [Trichomycterus rosablanca]|uniref:C-1-tetrahydrofolate synthase, cytoplasmic n=1 Tax=Trichomycterus rosablanca TaxID=2290929 RepID=UPI002F35A5FF